MVDNGKTTKQQQALGLLIDWWNPLPIDSPHPPIPEHHDVPPAAVAHFRASKVVTRIADGPGCQVLKHSGPKGYSTRKAQHHDIMLAGCFRFRVSNMSTSALVSAFP